MYFVYHILFTLNSPIVSCDNRCNQFLLLLHIKYVGVVDKIHQAEIYIILNWLQLLYPGFKCSASVYFQTTKEH